MAQTLQFLVQLIDGKLDPCLIVKIGAIELLKGELAEGIFDEFFAYARVIFFFNTLTVDETGRAYDHVISCSAMGSLSVCLPSAWVLTTCMLLSVLPEARGSLRLEESLIWASRLLGHRL